MMPRFATLFWMCVIAIAAFGLYMVKYRVLNIQKEIAGIEQELQQERESLHVASAEWAYLNRPARLQELAQKHLDLAPMQGMQMGSIAELPYPGQALAAVNSNAPVKDKNFAIGGPLIPASAISEPGQE